MKKFLVGLIVVMLVVGGLGCDFDEMNRKYYKNYNKGTRIELAFKFETKNPPDGYFNTHEAVEAINTALSDFYGIKQFSKPDSFIRPTEGLIIGHIGKKIEYLGIFDNVVSVYSVTPFPAEEESFYRNFRKSKSFGDISYGEYVFICIVKDDGSVGKNDIRDLLKRAKKIIKI